MKQPDRRQPPAVVVAAAAAVLAAGLGFASGGCKSDDAAAGAASPPPAPTRAPAPLAKDVGPKVTPADPARAKPAGANPAASVSPAAGETPAAATSNDVVARLDGATVTMGELQRPLVEAYGLNVLLQLVQLELAQRAAAEAGVGPVSEDDVAAERELTLAQMVPDAQKDDYDELLEQFLTQERISRPEFDLVLRTNAHLRQVARSLLKGQITDEQLDEAFRVMYGEKVKVRHIQASNLQEIQEVRRRVEAGEPFEKVAREVSRNERTRALGGELPAFSAAATGYPQSFKDAAFALKPGEMSDAIQAEGAYHVLLLEQRIPPTAVKFEDVKESIRTTLQDNAVQATMTRLRQQLGRQALLTMKIEHPELREQFEAKRDKRQADAKDRDQVRQQLTRERVQRMREQQGATPAGGAATQPAADGATPEAAPAAGSDAAPAAAPPDDAPAPVPGAAPPATAPATIPAAAR